MKNTESLAPANEGGAICNSKWIMPKALNLYRRNFYGNKRALLTEIANLIPAGTRTVADIFTGTGIVSWFLKHQGYRVITNDIMKYPAIRHRALIGNNFVCLDTADMEILQRPNADKQTYLSKYYYEIFGECNCQFLETWAANIPNLDDPIKKDIAVFIPIVCISKYLKFAAVHFSPYGTLTGDQHLRNKDLATDILKYSLDIFPQFIFDNGYQNDCHHTDAVELVSEIQADVIYSDSPYVCKAGNYCDHYTFFDDMASILSGNGATINNPYDYDSELDSFTDFSKEGTSIEGFTRLFQNSRHIPTIILSYNTTSKIDPNEISMIAKVYGREMTFRKDIDRPRPTTQKNRNTKTKEVLMVYK